MQFLRSYGTVSDVDGVSTLGAFTDGLEMTSLTSTSLMYSSACRDEP